MNKQKEIRSFLPLISDYHTTLTNELLRNRSSRSAVANFDGIGPTNSAISTQLKGSDGNSHSNIHQHHQRQSITGSTNSRGNTPTENSFRMGVSRITSQSSDKRTMIQGQ